MLRTRTPAGLHSSQTGIVPLVVIVALALLLVASVLLMSVGIPFSYHIGAPP
jgi:hypothetical protein